MWKISIKSFLEILEVALEHIWRHGALDAKGIMNWSIWGIETLDTIDTEFVILSIGSDTINLAFGIYCYVQKLYGKNMPSV